MDKIIEVNNLYKEYILDKNAGNIVNALRGVSLEIKKGEFTAIVGPSGSGKSTLLHLIGCLDKPSKGEIKLEGFQLSELKKKQLALIRRQKIGFIFQAYNLIPVLTALENITFPLLLLGEDTKIIETKAMEILKAVGLEGLQNRKPSELSGGQQQRIAIARAMIKKPSLILADEPTANLDSKTGSEILDLMLKLNEEEKVTFVFSTHDQMVMSYAKRIIKLKDGNISLEESEK